MADEKKPIFEDPDRVESGVSRVHGDAEEAPRSAALANPLPALPLNNKPQP